MTEIPQDEKPKPGAPPLSGSVLRTGIYGGSLLIIAMLGALVTANRMPGFEKYALERNASCYTLFVLLMFVPAVRFLTRPVQMFASAMIAWVMFDFRTQLRILGKLEQRGMTRRSQQTNNNEP